MPGAAVTGVTRTGTTGRLDAWLAAVGAPDTVLRSLVGELAAVGVRLHPLGHENSVTRPGQPRHGLVAFAVSGPAVVGCIRQLADGGRARVLAVSTAGTTDSTSWELLRAGASDAVAWADPAQSAAHVAARLHRWAAVDELLDCRQVRSHLVGNSPAWRSVLREAVEAARFTDAPVLITGESGTGKERLAEFVHQLDPRPAKKRLVVLDCTTIVPSLSGSEFFGHEKGAFTGAATPREGAFELADGGTLFLDEVGELPVALQAELLRVVQEGTYKRIGSNTWRTSRFRLICATNRDLEVERARGGFRSDFYYRIAGCRLHLPALEDRPEDVITLFRHFFVQARPDQQAADLDDPVRELLLRRRYPGNVRDLRGLVLRIAHRHVGDGAVTVGDVPDDERPDSQQPTLNGAERALRSSIRRAVELGATVEDITSIITEIACRPAADRDGGAAPPG